MRHVGDSEVDVRAGAEGSDELAALARCGRAGCWICDAVSREFDDGDGGGGGAWYVYICLGGWVGVVAFGRVFTFSIAPYLTPL